MQQGEVVGDEIVVRGDSDGAGNKESTSTKAIRMARNISREDNKEEINYNTKDLNHEVLSAVETVFKTELPRYQIHHRSFLPAILSFSSAHWASRPSFPVGSFEETQQTTGTSI